MLTIVKAQLVDLRDDSARWDAEPRRRGARYVNSRIYHQRGISLPPERPERQPVLAPAPSIVSERRTIYTSQEPAEGHARHDSHHQTPTGPRYYSPGSPFHSANPTDGPRVSAVTAETQQNLMTQMNLTSNTSYPNTSYAGATSAPQPININRNFMPSAPHYPTSMAQDRDRPSSTRSATVQDDGTNATADDGSDSNDDGPDSVDRQARSTNQSQQNQVYTASQIQSQAQPQALSQAQIQAQAQAYIETRAQQMVQAGYVRVHGRRSGQGVWTMLEDFTQNSANVRRIFQRHTGPA